MQGPEAEGQIEHVWEQVFASSFLLNFLYSHPSALKRHMNDYKERVKKEEEEMDSVAQSLDSFLDAGSSMAGG